MGGQPSKVPGGAFMAIRERNPDGFCFDVNQPMTFKDIYYKNKNRDPGEREFLVDDQQIDREKLGETLPYLGQKLEWDPDAKEYKPLKGMQWGTIVKGYEVGNYVYDSIAMISARVQPLSKVEETTEVMKVVSPETPEIHPCVGGLEKGGVFEIARPMF
ncbi:unnamed protein product [Cladocopium goreaui]|uniref:Uncharacterized protein n=1 Tax=Cladocopium goreaui TaxID=2562237 RepID=A0A9P1CA54_9DINO|nr:unnamed protein product [Cladocopium goreaui]